MVVLVYLWLCLWFAGICLLFLTSANGLHSTCAHPLREICVCMQHEISGQGANEKRPGAKAFDCSVWCWVLYCVFSHNVYRYGSFSFVLLSSAIRGARPYEFLWIWFSSPMVKHHMIVFKNTEHIELGVMINLNSVLLSELGVIIMMGRAL